MNIFERMNAYTEVVLEENRILGVLSLIGLALVVLLLALGFLMRHFEIDRGAMCFFGVAFLMPVITLGISLLLTSYGICIKASIWTPTEEVTALAFCLMFALGFGLGGYGLESS